MVASGIGATATFLCLSRHHMGLRQDSNLSVSSALIARLGRTWSHESQNRWNDSASLSRIPLMTVDHHSLAVPCTWIGSPGCISPMARTAVVRIVRADRPASHRAPASPLNDSSTASSRTRVSTPWSRWPPRETRRLFPVFVLQRRIPYLDLRDRSEAAAPGREAVAEPCLQPAVPQVAMIARPWPTAPRFWLAASV